MNKIEKQLEKLRKEYTEVILSNKLTQKEKETKIITIQRKINRLETI